MPPAPLRPSQPGSPHCCGRAACPWRQRHPNTAATHDLEGTDGHQAVAVVAVGPGVPAWVVALLQHKLLAGECLPLEAQPPAGPEGRGRHSHPRTGGAPQHEAVLLLPVSGRWGMLSLPPTPSPQGLSILRTLDLRARLHLDGAHLLQLFLSDVRELLRQLTLLPLEVLQLVDCDLKRGEMPSAAAAAAATLGGSALHLVQDPALANASSSRAKCSSHVPSIPTALTSLLSSGRAGSCHVPLPRQTAPRLRSTAKDICSVKHGLVFCP